MILLLALLAAQADASLASCTAAVHDELATAVTACRAPTGATLNKALTDPHSRSVLLTREEALLTLGLVEGLAELIDKERDE